MKDNRGLSLVELIVVIAILAVLSGAFITLWGLVPKSKCYRCAESLKKAVEGGRTDAISFFSSTVILEERSNGIYATTVTQRGIHAADGTGTMADTSIEKNVGKQGVKISYTYDETLAEDSFIELGSSKLGIQYKRSTGSFSYPTIDGIQKDRYLAAIKVECGNFVRILKLTQLTGNTELL